MSDPTQSFGLCPVCGGREMARGTGRDKNSWCENNCCFATKDARPLPDPGKTPSELVIDAWRTIQERGNLHYVSPRLREALNNLVKHHDGRANGG